MQLLRRTDLVVSLSEVHHSLDVGPPSRVSSILRKIVWDHLRDGTRCSFGMLYDWRDGAWAHCIFI